MDRANIGATGNFVIDHHSWVDGDTPLKPFWKTENSFWTSNDVRNTVDLGYAYPETQRWNYPTEKEYRIAVNASDTNPTDTGNQFVGVRKPLINAREEKTFAGTSASPVRL